MSIVKAEFSKEFYESLTNEQRNEITVSGSEDKGHDYSYDDIWIDLKYKATRAYKKLKEREFKLKQ